MAFEVDQGSVIIDGAFAFDREMAAAIEYDQRFRDDRNYSSLGSIEQSELEATLSEYWAQGGPEMESIVDDSYSFNSSEHLIRGFIPKRADPNKVVIWVYGGGWQSGSLVGNARLLRILASSSRCSVFGFDYSKAPDAQYPVQLDQLYQAVQKITHTIAPKMKRVCIGGYSAGANLVLSSFVRFEREFGPNRFSKVCLVSGVYDNEFKRPSYEKYANVSFGRSRNSMIEIIEAYSPSANRSQFEEVFPLKAEQSVASDFLIVNAEHDLLHDDSAELRKLLSVQGKRVHYIAVSGVSHLFLHRSLSVKRSADTIARIGGYFADS